MGTEVTMVLRLLLAVALGAVIGFQRERAKKPAGLRTHILICLGACLFTVVSLYGFGSDIARVAAGVVTGIGFIGAGAIIRGGREGGSIAGLTTAATMWAVAGIGLAVGAGFYITAVVAALLILLILLIPHHLVS